VDKDLLEQIARAFTNDSPLNYIQKEEALQPNISGMKIFDAPILACSAANDAYFALLKNTDAIGNHFLLPEEWLPGAQTVISFFLPFTENVRQSNTREKLLPSPEWLHGRVEGHRFLLALSEHLAEEIHKQGGQAMVPELDKRYWGRRKAKKPGDINFTSNWSQRHVAFVCGLGTFGLSKGVITALGVAGRFGSLITDLKLPPNKRPYTDIYEYCSKCGACAANCPAGAISLLQGKDHDICSHYLHEEIRDLCLPRHGCGKCQVNVPCETCIPL